MTSEELKNSVLKELEKRDMSEMSIGELGGMLSMAWQIKSMEQWKQIDGFCVCEKGGNDNGM